MLEFRSCLKFKFKVAFYMYYAHNAKEGGNVGDNDVFT